MNAPNLKRCLPLLLLVILSAPAVAQKKSEPDKVRDAFLFTRVKVSGAARSQPRRRPAASRVGLGYTVYQRGAIGAPVRVSASQEFVKGDAVRLVVESNIDGYLYVFHTENDSSPQMLFPDARLKGGANRIAAHTPYETPSSREPDPRHRWFVFDEKPAIERLYVVVTKQPLPNIPTGRSLVAYCRANPSSCPWRPPEANWKQVAAKADAPAREESSAEFGQALTAAEAEALERGLGLSLDAPAPAVIRISQSPKARAIAAVIRLNHK